VPPGVCAHHTFFVGRPPVVDIIAAVFPLDIRSSTSSLLWGKNFAGLLADIKKTCSWGAKIFGPPLCEKPPPWYNPPGEHPPLPQWFPGRKVVENFGGFERYSSPRFLGAKKRGVFAPLSFLGRPSSQGNFG